jgi:hypothetical protein
MGQVPRCVYDALAKEVRRPADGGPHGPPAPAVPSAGAGSPAPGPARSSS